MSLEALLPSAIDGLMLGFVYGLAALGLTLIFGVMKVINLSHGPIIALGMFAVFILFSGFGVNPYLGVLAAALVGLLLGVAIYFVAVDRVINATELTTPLATLFSFTILSGGTYELKSFVIVVLGGLGNPTGALVGGLVIGLLEGVLTVFIPVAWVPVVEYVIFVAVLLLRPAGLLGARA